MFVGSHNESNTLVKIILSIALVALHGHSFAQKQFPFESLPAIKYREFRNWKIYDKQKTLNKIHYTLTIPSYYNNGDTMTVQLTSIEWNNSLIRVFRNKALIQKFNEPMHFFSNVYLPGLVADINGDSLQDLKLQLPYLGNGLAAMNTRIIYLFQKPDGQFRKISFLDKLMDLDQGRPERDFNNDHHYEIITMHLHDYQNHNYWTFNIYSYENGDLISQNDKYGYPIMVQFLFKENFKVTDKIPADKKKDFAKTAPEDVSRN